MSKLQFALLNTGHREDDTEYHNIIRNFNRELDVGLDNYPMMKGEFPRRDEYDAGIIPGSSSSTYWDDGWIDALKEWVRGALDADFPILGVCFGHQVLAEVLGSDVRQMDEYELGYNEIEKVGESPVMDGIPDTFLGFTSHLDMVDGVPPGCEPIAENDVCLHGFQYESSYTVQFHPEYDMEMARKTVKGKDLPEEKLRPALESITDDNYRTARKTKRILDNFVDIVSERDRP